MISPFRKVRLKELDVQALQDTVAQIFNQLLKKQIIDGALISDIFIESGVPKSIDHGLDGPIRGWIVIRQNADSGIWESVSDTPRRTLILNASADVTISLWVF